MAPVTIHQVIDWILSCPTYGRDHERMVRVLSENAREFDSGSFQFTVGMYVQLNVRVDDGYHGIRGADPDHQRWFTLSPHGDGLILRRGEGVDIDSETVFDVGDAAELIRFGINYVATDA